VKIDHHLGYLHFIGHVWIIGDFLGHLDDDDISDIVVLKLVVLVTDFALFVEANGPISNSVFVPRFVKLDCLFAEPLLS
jgi:hypothetical protein